MVINSKSMEVERIDATEYRACFKTPSHVYNSMEFIELNAYKCDKVHYLAFRDSKLRLGLALGERSGRLLSPFSAPFGGWCYNREQRIDCVEAASDALLRYCRERKLDLSMTLPPDIYAGSMGAKMVSALVRSGAKIEYLDLNYHYDMRDFARFEDNLDSSTRNKLHHSMAQGFSFELTDDVARAYEVIRRNREARGFPLRMSLADVMATVKVVKADFFVMTLDGVDVAAAQVFHVAPQVVQVIYWGDIPEYSPLRAMNCFSYRLLSHYHSAGMAVVDIGPASSDGVPNYGLCEFKENIGCRTALKPTLSYKAS